MSADLPTWLSIGILVLVEPRQVTIFDGAELGVLYSECLIARLWYDGRVDYCNCFWELTLISKLVVQID